MIRLAPAPKDKNQLRSFLGLIHYYGKYGKFMPNLAATLHPLNNLLQSGTMWVWAAECKKASQEVKEMLMSASVLAHYDPKLPLQLAGGDSAWP